MDPNYLHSAVFLECKMLDHSFHGKLAHQLGQQVAVLTKYTAIYRRSDSSRLFFHVDLHMDIYWAIPMQAA